MSLYYTDYGQAEMNKHVESHSGEGFAFSTTNFSYERLQCDSCMLTIVKTNRTTKTRNTTQPTWAVENFLVIEWP